MTQRAKRKYLPAEAYRFLVLAFLVHRAPATATKSEIARVTRANHYMATRVLKALAEDRFVAVAGSADDGYAVLVTDDGRAFLDAHRAYFFTTFRAGLDEHYRFGARPPWSRPK